MADVLKDFANYVKSGTVPSAGAQTPSSTGAVSGATPPLPPTGEGAIGSGASGSNLWGKPLFESSKPTMGNVSTGSFTAAPAPAASGNLSLMDQQSTAQATTGAVGDDELVAKQMARLLGENSPYVDQARQRAIQLANSRGLQNTTLAASAGEEAAISQALPIATQDATTYSRQSLTNQDAQNKVSLFNASQGLESKKLGESARQFDATAGMEAAKLKETARQFDSETELKARLAQLDTDTKAYLANTEARYKTLMQQSASASDMWRQYQDAVSKIMTDDKLDQANKQAAIDLLGRQLSDGMQLVGAINGLDLGPLLTFSPGSGGNARVPGGSSQLPPSNEDGSSDPMRNPNASPGPGYAWDGQQWIRVYGQQGGDGGGDGGG